jgi:lipooligosaccharide transport system ATP-binding protein
MDSKMEYLITAHNVTKKYKQFTAVDSISFRIRSGECFGFLGPNGAGKTTLVKMIHCVSPVTSGELIVNGLPAHIDNRKIKGMTGIVPQETNLDSDLTVYENLLIFSQFFDIPRADAVKQIEELLKFVELEQKRNNKIDELSSGMKRRLLIARSLINRPNLIIADEPTTGLDPQARHLIWQRLRMLKDQGVTLVLTTQYMEEAQQLCDRIVVMHQGKILREGVPEKLIKEEIGEEVVEVRVPAEQDARILLHLKGISIHHERIGDTLYVYSRDGHDVMRKVVELDLPKVLNRPATLEDVFLKLTGRSLIE